MPTISAMDPGLRYDDADAEAAQARARNQDFMMRNYLQQQATAAQQQLAQNGYNTQEKIAGMGIADHALQRNADYGMQSLRGNQQMDQTRLAVGPQQTLANIEKSKWDAGDPQRQYANLLDNALVTKLKATMGSQGGHPGVPQNSANPSALGDNGSMMDRILAHRAGIDYISPLAQQVQDQTMRNRLDAAKTGMSGGTDSFTPQTLAGRAKFNEILQQTGDRGQATVAAQQIESGEAQGEADTLGGANAADLSRFMTNDTSMSGAQKGATEGGLGAAGGAALGAGIGSFVPGLGTVVGAAIGGGLGLLAGGTHGALTGRDDPTQQQAAQLLSQVKQEATAVSRARGIPLQNAIQLTKLKYRNALADHVNDIGADQTRALMASLDSM